jgi:upstream activation factor subunit UAF30
VAPPSSKPEPTPPKKTNGHHSSKRGDSNGDVDDEADEADEEIEVSTQPARKKQKRDPSLDADAKLAAELQAQEDRAARGRTTRGGGASSSKKATKKKAPKKKSATKVKDEDDSEVDTEESGTRKRKAGGGFQKPFNLSVPLGDLLGETQVRRCSASVGVPADVCQLSRPQVVKRLWGYIKGNALQDPSDGRQIQCDEQLQAVFKVARVDMFQMNKLISSHLYPIEE